MTKKKMLMALAIVCAIAVTGAALADQAADQEGQAFLQLLGKGEEAGGWCTWTCSNGQSGSGPAPDAESCRQMCEISCGEPCILVE